MNPITLVTTEETLMRIMGMVRDHSTDSVYSAFVHNVAKSAYQISPGFCIAHIEEHAVVRALNDINRALSTGKHNEGDLTRLIASAVNETRACRNA